MSSLPHRDYLGLLSSYSSTLDNSFLLPSLIAMNRSKKNNRKRSREEAGESADGKEESADGERKESTSDERKVEEPSASPSLAYLRQQQAREGTSKSCSVEHWHLKNDIPLRFSITLSPSLHCSHCHGVNVLLLVC